MLLTLVQRLLRRSTNIHLCELYFNEPNVCFPCFLLVWPRLFVNVLPYETLLDPIFFFLEEGFVRYVYGMVDSFCRPNISNVFIHSWNEFKRELLIRS